MAKVLISQSKSSLIYEYDTVTRFVRSSARRDTLYRCSEKMAMRIDIHPNTIYHRSYSIAPLIMDNIKSLMDLKKTGRFKETDTIYGMLIADSVKGFSNHEDFFKNAMSIQKYNKPYILDTFNYRIGNGRVTCTPSGSEETTYSSSMFGSLDISNESKVRNILGIRDNNNDYYKNMLEKYNLSPDHVYMGSGYIDVDGVHLDEMVEVRRRVF